MEITDRRRAKQIEYNAEHGITPKSVVRPVQKSLYDGKTNDEKTPFTVSEDEDVETVINEITAEMDEAASKLEFERAALLRDQIDALRSEDFSNGKKKRGRTYGKRGYNGRRR